MDVYEWSNSIIAQLNVAVHLMNNDVIPTFEAHGAKIDTVLSDNVIHQERWHSEGQQISFH
jgi:hypothetical protein